MNTIKSKEINNKISELRKKDIRNFQTNYFLNELDEEIQYLENDTAIVFLQPDRDIYRLYFAFINLVNFEALLKQLPIDIKISLEVLTKKEINADLFNCIDKYLSYDTTFERFRCKCKDLKIFQNIDNNNILYANYKDIAQIEELLNKTFNYYSSHLPSTKELKYLIDRKNVIVEKEDNKLSSIVVFKESGKNINFDQLVNLGNQPLKMMHVLDSLYSRISNDEYDDIFLWIDTVFNKDVIKLHRLYGYKSDLLKDYYFINEILRKTKK